MSSELNGGLALTVASNSTQVYSQFSSSIFRASSQPNQNFLLYSLGGRAELSFIVFLSQKKKMTRQTGPSSIFFGGNFSGKGIKIDKHIGQGIETCSTVKSVYSQLASDIKGALVLST